VPIDIPAVGVAGQNIKYAKAALDLAVDSDNPGTVVIPGQQLPSGALIIGYAYQVVDEFVDTGSSSIEIFPGEFEGAYPIDPVTKLRGVNFAIQGSIADPGRSYPIYVNVNGDGYSAGSMYIYVFYV